MNMRVKTSIGHELIDKQELTAAMTPAYKLHQIAMPQTAYDLHLRNVLLSPLLGALGYSFYGDPKVHIF
jgi:hypothetical protein